MKEEEHVVRRVRGGNTREKKERLIECNMERHVRERHDNCGVEGGGCDKQNCNRRKIGSDKIIKMTMIR